ncbi:MAG TPA: GNAT family N-acetyltransferase [Candidatus Udaeobacter sp.]|nr:GNAT family N-acetyltransferase [Candidatus Udaeobacter sp.]
MISLLSPYQSHDLEALRALVQDPSMRAEFDILQGPQGVESWLADPYRDPALHAMAWKGDELVGFSSPFVLPGREGRFAMVRLGVRGPARRRGVGTMLLAHTLEALAEHHPDVDEVCLSAWLPSPEAEGFASRHRFERVRSFWQMERRGEAIQDPEWPAGIERVPHDGTESRYSDITEAWNDSFARHYHSIESTPEEVRALFTRPGFRTDGYLLAYRSGRCVGFCRCELHEGRGEIAVLGTVEAARGIGLGRALLRWGVRWLERQRAPRITLLVDGENEGALRLYRGEGFEVARTRASWARGR